MNNLRKTTITTLEIAEMMEVSHADISYRLLAKDKCPWLITL